MSFRDIMIDAIRSKRKIRLTFNSKEKGIIARTCIPFDIGASKRYRDGFNRFHFYDLDSPDGKHNLSILPEQILSIIILDDVFEPEDYVNWEPKWYVKRDWGKFS